MGREEAVQVEDDAEGQGTDRIDDDALLQEVRPQGRGLQQMQCILDRLENVQYYVAAIMEELHIIFNAVEE